MNSQAACRRNRQNRPNTANAVIIPERRRIIKIGYNDLQTKAIETNAVEKEDDHAFMHHDTHWAKQLTFPELHTFPESPPSSNPRKIGEFSPHRPVITVNSAHNPYAQCIPAEEPRTNHPPDDPLTVLELSENKTPFPTPKARPPHRLWGVEAQWGAEVSNGAPLGSNLAFHPFLANCTSPKDEQRLFCQMAPKRHFLILATGAQMAIRHAIPYVKNLVFFVQNC